MGRKKKGGVAYLDSNHVRDNVIRIIRGLILGRDEMRVGIDHDRGQHCRRLTGVESLSGMEIAMRRAESFARGPRATDAAGDGFQGGGRIPRGMMRRARGTEIAMGRAESFTRGPRATHAAGDDGGRIPCGMMPRARARIGTTTAEEQKKTIAEMHTSALAWHAREASVGALRECEKKKSGREGKNEKRGKK